MITLCGRFAQRKIETHYRNSRFVGSSFYPLILCLLICDQSYLNCICILGTMILTAILNNKFIYFIRVILLALSLYKNHPQWCAFLLNQIYIPYWPMQVLFQMATIKRYNDIFWALGYLTASRFLEIVKRKFFLKFYLSDYETKLSAHIFNQVPYEMYALTQEGKVLRANHEFNDEMKKKFLQCVNKKKAIFISSENREYQVQQYGSNYKLIQTRFKCGEITLFQQQSNSVDNLYKLLCQDYQKWNNLRAFKVVKESDLNNMGQCVQDFRLLKHQLESINHLMYDQQQILLKSSKVEFFMKNYVVNLIESMIAKLEDHFNIIRLDFEEGIPDQVLGDKFNILYSLYTFLLTTQLVEQKQEQLKIVVCIAQVDNDKVGYDVEFSICFNWSPKITNFFCKNQVNNQQEELLQYMVQKCKQYMHIEYKQDEEDFIIFITTKMNPSCQCLESIDNIQTVELNFTKNIADQNICHIIWNSKRFSSPSISYDKTMRSPIQKYTAKFNNPESLSSTIQLKSIPNSTVATPSNSTPQSLANTMTAINTNLDLIKEVEHVIQYTIQFPQIQEDILTLLEDIIKQAYNNGLIDHDKTIIEEEIKNQTFDNDRISSISVQSEIQQEQFENNNNNQKLKELVKKYQTPQQVPRKLEKKEPDRNYQMKDIIVKEVKVKQKQQRKNRNEKQLSQLFSPCMMNKFKNNLVQIVSMQQRSKTQLPYLTDCNAKFTQKIAENRCMKRNIKWTNKIKLSQLPQKTPKILCFIPSTQFAPVVMRFGNSKYGDMTIGDALITYSVGELIQVYKQYFEQGLQFYFILIYIEKKSEIEELSLALSSNENQWINDLLFKQTNLIGLYNSAQLNKNLYQYLKYTIPLSQDQEQLQKSKIVIGEICK